MLARLAGFLTRRLPGGAVAMRVPRVAGKI